MDIVRSPHPSRLRRATFSKGEGGGAGERKGSLYTLNQPLTFRGKFQTVAPAWPSLRRTCGHPSDRDFPRNQTFCGGKMSRTAGGGILKGGTVGDSLKWRSLGTFLWSQRERCIAKRTRMMRVDIVRYPHPSRFACHLPHRGRQGSGGAQGRCPCECRMQNRDEENRNPFSSSVTPAACHLLQGRRQGSGHPLNRQEKSDFQQEGVTT